MESCRSALALAVLLPLLAGFSCAGEPPPPYRPEAPPATARIVTYDGVLHLGGAGFGSDPADGDRFRVEVHCPEGPVTILRSTDERVVLWQDDLIEVRGIPGVLRPGCEVTVHADGLPVSDARGVVIDEVRGRRSRPLPLSFFNSSVYPLSIAFSEIEGLAYLNPEFHQNIYAARDDGYSNARRIPVPQSLEAGGIFRGLGRERTAKSGLGEKIVIEPGPGAVWFSEGGHYLYAGSDLNASRILRYSPLRERFHCYNIPFNNAQVMGLLWEDPARRMWAALSSFGEAGAIVSFLPRTFDPDQRPCDHAFSAIDDERDYPAWSCASGGEAGCFRVYVVPPSLAEHRNPLRPAQLAMDASGDLWSTAFFGGGLIRLTPSTQEWSFHPFPASRGVSQSASLVGSGPWEILLDQAGKYLFISEFFDAQILRFDIELADTLNCTALDSAGENPCLTEYSAPVDTSREFLHSLVQASADTFYFTISTGGPALGDARLGRLVVDGENVELLLFPPLATLVGSTSLDDAAGIALDRQTGTLVVANPKNKSIDFFPEVGRRGGRCGLGWELGPVLPVLMRLHRRRKSLEPPEPPPEARLAKGAR